MKKIIKKQLKIDGMHCVSCALNIDWELEDTNGVKCSNTSYVKQVTEVEFDPIILSDGQVIDIVKKAGYSATLID